MRQLFCFRANKKRRCTAVQRRLIQLMKTGTEAGSVLALLFFLVILIRIARLIEDAAQEDADEIQQHHGESHHALGHDVRRGDHSSDEEDDHDGHAAHLLEDLRVDDAHLGKDDGDQRHLEHAAKDDEHGQAEVDVALDTGGGLDVLSTLDAGAEEPQHERRTFAQ